MFEYPKWKYSAFNAVIVDSYDDEVNLKGDWFNTPEEAVEALDTPDKESLLSKAEEIGAIVDKRWGITKIQSAIDEKILNDLNK